jgi:transcriptional regulator with XRE-family HTH domain
MSRTTRTPQTITFGKALKQARKNRRITQTELGNQINKDQSVISSYEQGHAEPPVQVVFAIEQTLGTEPGYLSQHFGYIPTSNNHRHLADWPAPKGPPTPPQLLH